MLDGFGGQARGLALAFDAVKARGIGRYLGAKSTSQQGIHGHSISLARDVPQRNIQRADGRHHRALAPVVSSGVVHAVPQHFGGERVGSQQQRLERMLDRRCRYFGRLQALGKGLAPADQARVGENLNQGGAALAHPALGECEGLGERAFEHMDPDLGDLHGQHQPALSRVAV